MTVDVTPKLQKSLSDAAPVPVYVLSHPDSDDEISVIDFWRIIVAHKQIILMSVLAAVILAALYVYFAEPLYRAEARLLPPQQQDILALEIDYSAQQGFETRQYTSDVVYKAFLRNFRSQRLRREFFDANELAKYYHEDSLQDVNVHRLFEKKFNNSLRLQFDKIDALFVTASFGDKDPELAAQRLNRFIAFANERTVRQLANDVNAVIQARIKHIRKQLATKVQSATQRRRDSIIRLKEALAIARTLGITDYSGIVAVAHLDQVKGGNDLLNAPLYMRGTKALEAEIAILESRKLDEPFIEGLRDLQEKLALLEGISINIDELSAVTVDDRARPPYEMDKPKTTLIFVLACVLGLMAGILLAFVAEFRVRTRALT